jgi:hypothetical protein
MVLLKNINQEIILLLVDFVLVLSNKDKRFLDVITYKPLSFAGNQTYFGLSDNEFNIFISVPDLIKMPTE